MNARLFTILTAAAVLFAGCDYDVYQITIRPRGHQFQRELTVWHVSTDEKGKQTRQVSTETLDKLRGVYGKSSSEPDAAKQAFRGTFRTRTPEDIGGAGTYARYDSPMGYACAYTERFGGAGDQGRVMEQRLEDIDKLTGHLIGWFQAEMGDDPRFDKLRTFMDKRLRDDLKTVSVYGWMGDALSTCELDDGANNAIERSVQYLIDRGYFGPDDAPGLYRAAAAAGEDNGKRLLEFVRWLLARKMGAANDEPIPESLDFLADTPSATNSLLAYLRTTDDYKELEAQAEEGEAPNPLKVIEPLVSALAPPHVGPDFGGSDRLVLALETPVEPWRTNGEWNAAESAVSWEKTLRRAPRVGIFCHAMWSAPDEEFQKAHFGKVVLSGSDLLQHCIWRQSLTAAEAAQWDAFMAGLEPSDDLEEKLSEFRLSGEPAQGGDAGYAEHAVDRLVEGLKASD